MYIGLYDTHQTLNFMWADETPFSYRPPFRNNFPVTPVTSSMTRVCVAASEWGIYNLVCTHHLPAICEKSKKNHCVLPLMTEVALQSAFTFTLPNMFISACFESCRAYGYVMSAVNSTTCYCFPDAYPANTNFNKVSWINCDQACIHNPYQICGSTSDYMFATWDQDQAMRSSCEEVALEGIGVSPIVLKGGIYTDCSAVVNGDCPDSWLLIDSICYRIMLDPVADAHQMCQVMGGYMAVFETQTEADNVMGVVQSLSDTLYWRSGLFRTFDESSKLAYTNGWWVDEYLMSQASGWEPGAQLHHPLSNFSAFDILKSSQSYPYICEKGEDYLGCYQLDTDTMNGFRVISNYPLLTVRQCKEACLQVAWIGWEDVGITQEPQPSCYCFDESSQGKVEDYLCTSTCAKHQPCGASGKLSVYMKDNQYHAADCSELYRQGMLLTLTYKFGDYDARICGMKNSTYPKDRYTLDCVVNACEYPRVMVGDGDTILSVDVSTPGATDNPEQVCVDLLEPEFTHVASIRTDEAFDLLVDVLNWKFDSTNTPTVIGLLDEFQMGCYTWSDSYLFSWHSSRKIEDFLPVIQNANKSIYATIDYTGRISSPTDTYTVVCGLNNVAWQNPWRYMFISVGTIAAHLQVLDYSSMTVTLCRQICQGQGYLDFFISLTNCVCGNSAVFVPSSGSGYTHPCPGNRLQLCGSEGSLDNAGFIRYVYDEPDIASNCYQLYDNFVLLTGQYLVGEPAENVTCGMDDQSIDTCTAGFIAKDSRCLRFVRLETENVTSAAQSCLNFNGRLATVWYQEDIDRIVNMTQQITTLKTAQRWTVGMYSRYTNGHYVDSYGHLIPPSADILQGVDLDEACMAIDVGNRSLVAVSCETVMPYVCERHYIHVQQCVDSDTMTAATPSLSLPTSMSVHQCLAICRGQGALQMSMQGSDCYCGFYGFTNTQDLCSDPCPGSWMQRCARPGRFTVYEHSGHPDPDYETCDDLLKYGITAPGDYIMASQRKVTCFKYSQLASHMNYILTENSETALTVNSVEAPSLRMDIRLLTTNGWNGSPGVNYYTLQFDLPDIHVIQGIVLQGVPGYGRVLQFSVQHMLVDGFTESYPKSPITVNYDSPSELLVWLDLEVPFAARQIVIQLLAWEGDVPGASFEFVGYNFVIDWVDTHYMGLRDQLQQESTIVLEVPIDDLEECISTCVSGGYYYFRLSKATSGSTLCGCLRPANSTRDFYTELPNAWHCLDHNYVCMEENLDHMALYTTTSFSCENLATSNMDITKECLVGLCSNSDHQVGTTISLSCVEGTNSSTLSGGTFNTTCTNYGVWHPEPSQVSCEPVDCGAPPSLLNATLLTTDNLNTTYQSTVSYACSGRGHVFEGLLESSTLTCSATGEWMPAALPACVAIVCPDPTPMDNAELLPNVYGGPFVYGDTATLQCLQGGIIDGTYDTFVTITCQIDSEWSSTPTTPCRVLDCSPELPNVMKAYGSLISDVQGRYTCNGGTTFEDGSPTKDVFCDQNTNLWPTSNGQCTRKTNRYSSQVCLVHQDKCMNTNIIETIVQRSVFDCILACAEVDYCRTVCYNLDSQAGDTFPNCVLYFSAYMPEYVMPISGWSFYDTYGLDC